MPDNLELPSVLPAALPPHPRLLTPAQFQSARFAINRSPQREWFLLLRQQADLPVRNFYRRVNSLAIQAKACAVMFRLTGEAVYREKALTLLKQLPDPPEIIDPEGGAADRSWGDYLQSAEPVPDICVVYDLLYDEMPLALRETVERKVLGVTEQLIDAFMLTPRNNHVTVMAIAVTTAALAFDHPEKFMPRSQPELYRVGMTHLSQSLGLVAPDGGYGEGVYYARYIVNYLSPFSVYMQNSMGVRLFEHPYLQRMVNWIIDNDKGSGEYTQFDDAYTTRFFYLPLIIPSSPFRGLWDEYFRARPAFRVYYSSMAEALLTYRERASYFQTGLFFPAKFYPDIGQVVFRDRQVQPRFFASFTYERERYFADVHEQIDPLSMELSAFGEDFIIDGGYGSGTLDADRPYFISQQANSTILVDGFGSNPNPLSGDELQATLDFGFATKRFAAASLSQQIGDALVRRQVFFPGANRLLIFDSMEGSEAHSYTVQLNTLGSFSDRGNGRLSWQKNGVRLNAHLLTDDLNDWQVRESAGLKTGGGTVSEVNKILLQSKRQKQACLVSLLVAEQNSGAEKVVQLPLVNGQGEWRQMRDFQTGKTEDVVWNRRDTVVTDRWQSDARLTWVRSRSPQEPVSLLLVDGSFFRQGNLVLKFSRPVTFYLERRENSRLGFVHFSPQPEPVELSVSGIATLPVRLNGLPLKMERRQNRLLLKLSRSGYLTFGSGEPLIRLPEKSRPETDFLQWINRRPPVRQNAAYWSDYENNLFTNRVTRHLLQGTSQVFSNWGGALNGDSLLFHRALNVTQGLLQYGYRSTSDGRGFRLPHRYAVSGELGGAEWQVSEGGDWRKTGAQVRDLWIRSTMKNRLHVAYRWRQPFGDYRGQQFSFDIDRRLGVNGYLFRTGTREVQDYGLFLRQQNWAVQPSLLVREKRLSTLRLNGRFRRLAGSFRAVHLGSNPEYFQVVESGLPLGFNGLLEGRQVSQSGEQFYRANIAGEFAGTQFLSGGIGLSKNTGWTVAEGAFNLSGWFRRVQQFQSFQYLDRNWYWQSAVSGYARGGLWSADLFLKNWRLGEEGVFRFSLSQKMTAGVVWNSRWRYGFDSGTDGYRLNWQQQWFVPVSGSAAFLPRSDFQLGSGLHSGAVGGGVSRWGAFPLYLNLVQYRQQSPFLYRWDWSTLLPLGRSERLQFGGTLLWAGELLQYGEVRIQQVNRQGVRPGIYYRYRRPGERRLEGFLEWRW